MQVKRFFAADMRQAMKLVRDELGPDAAILGNRRVAGGIELTAALDYQAPPAPSKPNPALEVELRKTQARIAEARAELTARPAENQRKDRQLFAEEKPARPSLAESMTAAQAKPQAGGQTLEAMRFELNGLRELIGYNWVPSPGASCSTSVRSRPISGGACSAWACRRS